MKEFLVCFPYEFTLLSNGEKIPKAERLVCFPYEFTLLSNAARYLVMLPAFVSPTNLHCSQTACMSYTRKISLFPLRIYTALKLENLQNTPQSRLFPLRIYTALKLRNA